MLSRSVDYIVSPFDAQEVLWRVETHLSLHRLRASLESAIHEHATKQAVTCEQFERALRETLTLARITGRKHAEEKLRERESELRQVLDLAPQHIAVMGPEESRLFANQASLDYYGLTLEGWRECDLDKFLHPDDIGRMASVAHHTELSNVSAEVRLLRKDGTYRWLLVHRNALLDGRGDLLRWYVAATDIEDRKQAEERLQTENVALREEIDKASMFEEVVGNSPPLQTVLSRVAKVAPTETTVLVTGETGTGKELVARAIHRRSQRSQRAFVSMNCAGVPRDLISSELFGHEKGAFTGATQRRLGRFELADGGTIFLDEIGELPPDTQSRVLESLAGARVRASRSAMTDHSQFIIDRSNQNRWMVTFSNPPINIFVPTTIVELGTLMTQLEADPSVKVVVFQSANPEFFSAHLDVAKAAERPEALGLWRDFVLRLSSAPVVSIAKIRGRTRGIGNEFVLACDMRFASRQSAVFGQPEIGVGLVPGGGALEWLPRLVGRSRALEIVLSGDDFDADIAERYGWVNRTLDDDDLDSFVDTLVGRLASFDCETLAAAKAQLNRFGTPTATELQSSNGLFFPLLALPSAQARRAKIRNIGYGVRSDFELNFGRYLPTFGPADDDDANKNHANVVGL